MYCSPNRQRDSNQSTNACRLANDSQHLFGGEPFCTDQRRVQDIAGPSISKPLDHWTPSPLTAEGATSSETSFVERQQFAVQPAAMADRVETGKYLECAAIALAAPVLTKQQIAVAWHTNEQLRGCGPLVGRDTARFLAQSFHLHLLAACPNAYMVTLFHRQIFSHSAPKNNRPMSPVEVTRAAEDHDKILQMIKAKASTKSIERFLSTHVTESEGCRTIG